MTWKIETIGYDGTVTSYAYNPDTMTDEKWDALMYDLNTMVRTRDIARFRII